MNMFTPSRILITGVTGFVGKHLVQHCRQRYPDALIYGLCRNTKPENEEESGFISLPGDLLLPEQVYEALVQARPDLIFHLAAQSSVAESWHNPAQTLQINAGGFIHLLEAARYCGLAPRIIVAGSSAQYGIVPPDANPVSEEHPFQPASPYAVSKVTQDLYAYQHFLAYKLPIIRVRPFNHFGPLQSSAFVVSSLALQIALIEAKKAEPVLLVGNLQAQRDFLPVSDVVSAYLAIAERGQPGMAYNVGSGKAYSIEEIAQALLAHSHISIQLCEDPTYTRPVEQPVLIADISLIKSHTGWQPTNNLDTALRHTLDYWRSHI